MPPVPSPAAPLAALLALAPVGRAARLPAHLRPFALATRARARRRIADSPTARTPEPAPRGAIGTIEDVLPHDGDAGLVVVDFAPHGGVLLCDPDELTPLR